MERVYLSPPSELSKDKKTTLVDVIFVDSLDAGSIPATSTNLRQGFGWHASAGRSLDVLSTVAACAASA